MEIDFLIVDPYENEAMNKVGLQTTFERPIINTRDESHSTDAYRRLHVIVGDANRMEVPQALKLGTTSMLLWLLEHADEAGFDLNAFLDEHINPGTYVVPANQVPMTTTNSGLYHCVFHMNKSGILYSRPPRGGRG